MDPAEGDEDTDTTVEIKTNGSGTVGEFDGDGNYTGEGGIEAGDTVNVSSSAHVDVGGSGGIVNASSSASGTVTCSNPGDGITVNLGTGVTVTVNPGSSISFSPQ